ncbi:MAG: DUF2478 domain-containing protein [Myxococcaceae bacterium]
MAHWAVITYGKAVDRGAEVRELASHLRARGLSVAGFAQEKQPHPEGGALYDLVRLGKGERLRLGGTSPKPAAADTDSKCSFSFDPAGFARAFSWLAQDAAGAQVLVLSEVSKLEAGGEGHHAALKWALALPSPKAVVFVARAEQLSYLVEKLSPPGEPLAYLELPSGPAEKDAFVEALAAALEAKKPAAP